MSGAAVGGVHAHVLHQHPTYDAIEKDETADDEEHDARGCPEWDRRQAEEKHPHADDEGVVAARKAEDAERMRTLLEVDDVLDGRRWQLEVVARGFGPGRVGFTPNLERRRGHLARGPKLVATVAALVDEALRDQAAPGTFDRQARVGHVDV